MAIDFPTSPTVNQVYNYAGVNYIYTSQGTWSAFGRGGYTSSTPPSSPTPGTFWFDLTTGVLAIWIDDGTSQQWVQISPAGVGASYAPLASPALTGTPTAPTAANTVNDQTIATTQYVKNVIGPRDAFKANRSGSNQTVTDSTYTKVLCGVEVFDDNSKYDNGTMFRWIPSAGRVVVIGSVGSSATTFTLSAIYKNGAQFAIGSQIANLAGGLPVSQISIIDSANGTDYYELYCYLSGSTTLSGATSMTWFGGHMI